MSPSPLSAQWNPSPSRFYAIPLEVKKTPEVCEVKRWHDAPSLNIHKLSFSENINGSCVLSSDRLSHLPSVSNDDISVSREPGLLVEAHLECWCLKSTAQPYSRSDVLKPPLLADRAPRESLQIRVAAGFFR